MHKQGLAGSTLGEVLTTRWASEDPNPVAVVAVKRAAEVGVGGCGREGEGGWGADWSGELEGVARRCCCGGGGVWGGGVGAALGVGKGAQPTRTEGQGGCSCVPAPVRLTGILAGSPERAYRVWGRGGCGMLWAPRTVSSGHR